MSTALAEAKRWNEGFSSPRVAIEPLRPFEGTEEYKRRTQVILDAERSRQATFIAEVEQVREQVRQAVAGGTEQGIDMLPHLTSFIEEVSQGVHEDREAYEAAKRQWKRFVKEGRSVAPEVGRAFAEVRDQVLDLYATRYNSRAEFYYFLLALRAEYDPNARGGPIFDDPEEMVRYLRSVTA